MLPTWSDAEVEEALNSVPDTEEYRDFYELLLWHRKQMAYHEKMSKMLSQAFLKLKN